MKLRKAITQANRKPVIAQFTNGFGFPAFYALEKFAQAGADALAVSDRLDLKRRNPYIEGLTREDANACVSLANTFRVPSLLKVAFAKKHGWGYRQAYIKRVSDMGFDAILNIPHHKDEAMTVATALYAQSLGMEVVWEFTNYDQFIAHLYALPQRPMVLINQRNLSTDDIDPNGICEFMDKMPWNDVDDGLFIGGSGLNTVRDALEAFEHACDAVILSTALMKGPFTIAPKMIRMIKEDKNE